jgi:predicted nucleic acid-binding protein
MRNKPSLIDTNVIVRFLVEDPRQVQEKFRGVFTFFPRVEMGEIVVELPELVLFEVFFVLTKLYQVPPKAAAQQLETLLSFKGIVMKDRSVIKMCLRILQKKSIGLVDAYLLASSRRNGMGAVYTFDQDLIKQGLRSLEVK